MANYLSQHTLDLLDPTLDDVERLLALRQVALARPQLSMDVARLLGARPDDPATAITGRELASRYLDNSLAVAAVVAVVGNEDGAHHTTAELVQALDDVGYSVAANASTYWVGEAMQGVDYNDHEQTPETTASTTATAAQYAVHLAQLLATHPYPAQD